jgi:hypothetical protein
MKSPKKKVRTFVVSRLTRPWAVKNQESIIRALAGSSLDGVKIKIKINESK